MHLIDIPGDQRETYEFRCEACGHENRTSAMGEKGVDVELVSYLFTTSRAWDKACIFSKDTDFAPAVRALRSMGKKISCAGVSEQRASALVRGSHHYRELALDFIVQDAAVYAFLLPGGPLDKLVIDLENRPGVTVGLNRPSQSERDFAQNFRQFELGIAHAPSEPDVAWIKDRVDAAVAAVPRLDDMYEWESRSETVFLHLSATPLRFLGFDRYAQQTAKSARWAEAYGSVFARKPHAPTGA